MRLRDLSPALKGTLAHGSLRFICPCVGHSHSIVVPFGRDSKWVASGECPDTLTVIPSVNADVVPHVACWHGHITNGNITNAGSRCQMP